MTTRIAAIITVLAMTVMILDLTSVKHSRVVSDVLRCLRRLVVTVRRGIHLRHREEGFRSSKTSLRALRVALLRISPGIRRQEAVCLVLLLVIRIRCRIPMARLAMTHLAMAHRPTTHLLMAHLAMNGLAMARLAMARLAMAHQEAPPALPPHVEAIQPCEVQRP